MEGLFQHPVRFGVPSGPGDGSGRSGPASLPDAPNRRETPAQPLRYCAIRGSRLATGLRHPNTAGVWPVQKNAV